LELFLDAHEAKLVVIFFRKGHFCLKYALSGNCVLLKRLVNLRKTKQSPFTTLSKSGRETDIVSLPALLFAPIFELWIVCIVCWLSLLEGDLEASRSSASSLINLSILSTPFSSSSESRSESDSDI
jgi:hypothetical protein